jgi:hypothetical protein
VINGRKSAIEISIQTIRIEEQLAIAAVPGETFSSLGMEVKRRSPLKNTLRAGYSNGWVSYVPTRDAFPPQGWSIRERYCVPGLIFQGYLLPTALTLECGH